MDDRSECALCRSSQSSLVQVGVRHATQADVRQCTECGFVFRWPRPAAEELARYYEEHYREDYAEPAAHERFRTDLDEARSRVRRLLPLLRPDTRLLEIGCGSGAFLDAVRPYVGGRKGIEPDAASRAYIARELKLSVLTDVADALREKHTFDLVVLFHVLEHVLEPVEFLRTLCRLLNPAGRLVIEVPNLDDALIAIYKVPAYLRFYYQKAHLSYFTRTTLGKAIEQAGLVAAIEGVQRYDLSNHLRWMLTGEPGGQGYYHNVLLPSVDAAYADALIRADSSDTLWAVAQTQRRAG